MSVANTILERLKAFVNRDKTKPVVWIYVCRCGFRKHTIEFLSQCPDCGAEMPRAK